MDAIKQSIGIDIFKDTFFACRCYQTFSSDVSYTSVHSFTNDKNGFNQLIRWSRSQTEKNTEVVFLMEATGV